jgi:hypothetical protein
MTINMPNRNNLRSKGLTVIKRLIFSLWLVPNPLGYIITNLPRSRARNLVGVSLCITIGVLSICFLLPLGTSSVLTKVAVSVIVGIFVMLIIFALFRRIRLMK